MSGIFSKPKVPEYTPPPPPSPPTEDATFKPGGDDEGRLLELKKRKTGKKRLQIQQPNVLGGV